MIRIQCKNCGSKLNAKPELVGQTRKCPKCGSPVVILDEAAVAQESDGKPTVVTAGDPAPTPIIFANPAVEALPAQNFPTRLSRSSRYLICDQQNVRAAWANDGRGWMLKISSGFSPAKINRDALPAYGNFTLVELVMKHTDDGIKLDALEMYQLASRFAMPKLERNDDDICESITAHGSLSRDQKASVYQIFRTLFMREVWGDSTEVIGFLQNYDYVSHSSRGSESPAE
jgi:hypothetical protein